LRIPEVRRWFPFLGWSCLAWPPQRLGECENLCRDRSSGQAESLESPTSPPGDGTAPPARCQRPAPYPPNPAYFQTHPQSLRDQITFPVPQPDPISGVKQWEAPRGIMPRAAGDRMAPAEPAYQQPEVIDT